MDYLITPMASIEILGCTCKGSGSTYCTGACGTYCIGDCNTKCVGLCISKACSYRAIAI